MKIKKIYPAIPEVKEQGHYETIAEYPNGGKDVRWIVDVEAVKAKKEWTEYEDILRYTPYTQKQIDEEEILELKSYLSSTDYVCNKIVEGVATKEDYADVLIKRQEARERINELMLNK